MPRLSYADEEAKRQQATELIEGYALHAARTVYLSPSVLANIAERKGMDLDRQYFTRRYEELGIVYDESIGLWINPEDKK